MAAASRICSTLWMSTGHQNVTRPAKRSAVGALVAHGGDQLLAPGQLAQRARFVDGAREGFFAEDGLAGAELALQGHECAAAQRARQANAQRLGLARSGTIADRQQGDIVIRR